MGSPTALIVRVSCTHECFNGDVAVGVFHGVRNLLERPVVVEAARGFRHVVERLELIGLKGLAVGLLDVSVDICRHEEVGRISTTLSLI